MLATLSTTILEPDLYPRLAETEPLAQLLPHKRVGIVRLVEEPLELGQLLNGEVRSRSPLLTIATSIAPTIGSYKLIIVQINVKKRYIAVPIPNSKVLAICQQLPADSMILEQIFIHCVFFKLDFCYYNLLTII